MFKKLLISLLLAGMLFSVNGCSEELTDEFSTTASEGPAEYTDLFLPLKDFQSQSYVDSAMSVEVGEKLKVVLEANPTSGYQWQENARISDSSVIRQIEHRFVVFEANTPGSPGQDVWTFEALKKGVTIISIECSRPWEDRDLSIWEVTITTTVK